MLDWLRRNAQRSPRLYAFLRSVRRMTRRTPPTPRPLPTDAFRARIAMDGQPPAFNIGGSSPVVIEVTNRSRWTWPGVDPLALSYHWWRDGKMWAFDGGRTDLPAPLPPGTSMRLDCAVRSPNTPGTYVLEFDLVSGEKGWFSAHGGESARYDIVVGGMRPETQPEIDYEQIYAAADLARDYWLVSGPSSPEEFAHIGLAKRKLVEEVGLRPDSKVLDIGCGTGSLTGALAEFLSREGFYFGTDLSEIAVQFCREKYPQPNFRFAKNGMTTIPIQDMRFDFIVFFSVFTHTYLPETRELLAEAVRLLNDGGRIVADVFESDLEGESVGTRAMIVLDRGRMLDIADGLGLEGATLSAFTWDSSGEPIDRVMRSFSKRRVDDPRSGTAEPR